MKRFATLMLFFLCSSCAARTVPAHISKRMMEIPSKRVYFASAQTMPKKNELSKIRENAEWLAQHDGEVIIVEGHCDERGSSDYNLELGDRRARSVKQMLSELGVAPERIIILSRGEAEPIDPDLNEHAWQKNRRVEFVLR